MRARLSGHISIFDLFSFSCSSLFWDLRDNKVVKKYAILSLNSRSSNVGYWLPSREKGQNYSTSSPGLFPQKMGGAPPHPFFEGKALRTRLKITVTERAKSRYWTVVNCNQDLSYNESSRRKDVKRFIEDYTVLFFLLSLALRTA